MTLYYSNYQSPIGTLHLYADEDFLVGVFFESKHQSKIKANNVIKQTVKELDEYFAKKRTSFEIPLKISGTEFQKNVWSALLRIPYGSTCSYSNIATLISNPKSTRAVGTANGKNNFPILIPCHRVIKVTGEIGGYAGGVELKKYLLELEK